MTDKHPKPLSKEEFKKRQSPATSEELLGALHDKVHKDVDNPARKVIPARKHEKPL